MRTLCIGDIHGAHRALVQVLHRAGFHPDRDRLISLGDLCDGWPDGPEVLETLLQLPYLIAIKGNHDIFLEELLAHQVAHPHWAQGEGAITLARYQERQLLDSPEHLNFLQRQKLFFVDDQLRCFVHGGYDVERPIFQQSQEYLCWNRSMWETLGASALLGFDPPPDTNPFREVFIGHTPTHTIAPDLKPVRRGKVWNLDQGAKYGGKLTVMDIESKEYWQSDTLGNLYPEIEAEK